MKLIVMLNNKGGVGKTTSAVNLAAWFAELGKKTLVIDLDPSACASLHFGLDKSDNEYKTQKRRKRQKSRNRTRSLQESR